MPKPRHYRERPMPHANLVGDPNNPRGMSARTCTHPGCWCGGYGHHKCSIPDCPCRTTPAKPTELNPSLGLRLITAIVSTGLAGTPGKGRRWRGNVHAFLGGFIRIHLIVSVVQIIWATGTSGTAGGIGMCIIVLAIQLLLRGARRLFSPLWDDLAEYVPPPVPAATDDAQRLADDPTVPIEDVIAAAEARGIEQDAAQREWYADEPGAGRRQPTKVELAALRAVAAGPDPALSAKAKRALAQHARRVATEADRYPQRYLTEPEPEPEPERLPRAYRVLIDPQMAPTLERWAYAHPGKCLGSQGVHLFWTPTNHQACRCGAYSWWQLPDGHWRDASVETPHGRRHTQHGCQACHEAFTRYRHSQVGGQYLVHVRREHRAALAPKPEPQPNRRHTMMVGASEWDCERNGHLMATGDPNCQVCEERQA